MKQRQHKSRLCPTLFSASIKGLGARLSGFNRSEEGAIAIMFALMLPVLVGILALGVDVGLWFKDRREMQTMADAAAVSAAIENSNGSTQAQILTVAQIEAAANGFDATTDTLDYAYTPTSGAYVSDTGYIEVRITRQLETILSQVFITLDPTTTARAVATTISDQDACVLALSDTASGSIYLNGAGTEISMTGCSVVANSDSDTAINVQNGTLTTECLWTAGGINENGVIDTACSTPVSNASTVEDPYADLSIPSFSSTGCLTGNGNNAYAPNAAEGTDTIDPGVFCDGITISAGEDVTMNAGTYYIDEGDFFVAGNASVTGTGVTIILTSNSGSGYGSINITGGGSVNLKAPTDASDPFRGILFFQDPNTPTNPSNDSTITGGSEVDLGGAIYLPTNNLSFSGGSSVGSNDCLMLVAQEVSFNGNAAIDNECDLYGGNAINYGTSPGLVE